MNPKIILCLALLAASLAQSFATDQSTAMKPGESSLSPVWGDTVNGLRIGLTQVDTEAETEGDFDLLVSLENRSKGDLVLNLGMMLANGGKQYPTALYLLSTDSNGNTRKMEFLGPVTVDGRMDPLVVPLPAGALYTLRCKLDNFSHDSLSNTLAIGFEGKPVTERDAASDMKGSSLMPYWTGMVKSGQISISEGIASFQVASFQNPNQPAQGKETGKQISALLRAHHIFWIGISSGGWVDISVFGKDVRRARSLIAQAIKTDKLKVELGPEYQHIPSPVKGLALTYSWSGWIDDIGSNLRVVLDRVVGNMGSTPWIFTTQGMAMEFSWSPDAHYLLFGIVQPDHGMTLEVVDTHAQPIKERDLQLAVIEKQVAAQLPTRHAGAFAHYGQIDFNHVEWTSSTQCRLHYAYEFDRQAGDAILELDLSEANSQLKIVQVTSRPEP